ncbi:MAG: Ig-like domain-containing protein, partial [Anaerolineae bacterium]|nr:Ig-like domain-containing protein [Anaerolineae bacterium]
LRTSTNVLRTASRRALMACVAISILASACSSQPTPTPILAPTSAPVPATPTPLPPKPTVAFIPVNSNEVSPIIVSRSPENGERLAPSGAIRLVFDRAMNQDSVASALQITPRVEGKLSWTNNRTATFTPNAALPRNTVFDVAITQDARAFDGARLSAPYQFRLTTQGNLEVGQTIPADGANDVDPDTRITVLFNRPVVPLTTIAQQAGLPQPLSCTPAIEGTQEWLNTSILVLKPIKPFPGGTQFACKVAGNLQDTDGNPMAGEFAFAFSTAAPKVIGYSPQPQDDFRGGQTRSRVDAPISVQFNQPVDLASAQAAFSLSTVRIGAQAVPGVFELKGSTLVFTPSQKLSF